MFKIVINAHKYILNIREFKKKEFLSLSNLIDIHLSIYLKSIKTCLNYLYT